VLPHRVEVVRAQASCTDVTTASQEKKSGRCAEAVNIESGGVTGGAEEGRTPGLRIANAALCQLSYCPTPKENTVSSFEFQVSS